MEQAVFDQSGAENGGPGQTRVVAPPAGLSDRFGRWAFHPVLFGLYPILALFAQNAREVRTADPIRVVAFALLGTMTTWIVLSLLLRESRKAALIASAAVVLFFSFSFAVGMVEEAISFLTRFWVRREVAIPPVSVLVPEVLLLGGLSYLVVRKIRDARTATAFLNFFSIALLVIPASQAFSVKRTTVTRPRRVAGRFDLPPRPSGAAVPDIYYIILDGYARHDVMKSLFGFDNSAFLTRLEERGFYVARKSTANYCQTPLSLSASLNAVYLDELVKGLENDQTELSGYIGKSSVVETLRPLGYKFVTFATGFDPTEFPMADVYLSPHPYSSGFERMVIDLTPLRVIWPNPARFDQPTQSRQRTSFLLDRLAGIADDPAPTFTLAHVFCPHPPFVFGENGEDVSAQYRKYTFNLSDRIGGRFRDPTHFSAGYRDQSAFITARIEATIDRLLERSPEPPIIILQSDHGSELNLDAHDVANTDLKERMSILNAYYFPGRRYQALYQRITPVNSFRIVLNTYFGASLDLLPDRSFFSTWTEPYMFHDVTAAVRSPEP